MILFIVWGAIAVGAIVASTTSCSISYQNISTHGTATDLVDETQSTSPDIQADATANVSAIPKVPGTSLLK